MVIAPISELTNPEKSENPGEGEYRFQMFFEPTSILLYREPVRVELLSDFGADNLGTLQGYPMIQPKTYHEMLRRFVESGTA